MEKLSLLDRSNNTTAIFNAGNGGETRKEKKLKKLRKSEERKLKTVNVNLDNGKVCLLLFFSSAFQMGI